MATLLDGTPVAVATARRLIAGVGRVLAVTRPGRGALVAALQGAGCEVLETADCERGMGASIAAGVRASPDAGGWLILPADMPTISVSTITVVNDCVVHGSLITRPVYDGRPGHPVGFHASLGNELGRLDGDTGARGIVARHRQAMTTVAVVDPGIHTDVDTPADLARLTAGGE